MGNRRLYNGERIHMPGTPESERLLGYRPKSFPPDRLSPSPRNWFFYIVTQPQGERREGSMCLRNRSRSG